MKTHFITLLAVFFLTQCHTPNNSDSNLHFTINSFDVEKDQMEVTFEVTNPSNEAWQGGQWTLHWNQFSGSVLQESLPEGIQILPTKNSQYWQLEFGPNYTLEPGEKLSFKAVQKGIMKRLVMGPIGFFVHHKMSDQSYDLEHAIHWETAQGVDQLNLPNAKDRYESYEGISSIAKEELHWILPSPQKVEWQKEYRPFPEQLNIDFGTMGGSSEFLISRLQKGLKSKIISNGETVQIRVLENKGLGNEDYQLHIDPNEILVSAAHYKGLFYGLGSLHQILYNAQNEGLGIPLLHIEDSPRFGHRGFMLDLSRNFFPKDKILQILDHMAAYKLNVMDLKLSDDEGWRIEIPDLKELTEVGSMRGFTLEENDKLFPMYGSGSGEKASAGSGYLTRNDFIEILNAATKRNIRIVPQISFPSHSRAAIIAMKVRYENLLVAGDEEGANEYRLHDPKDASEYTSAQLFKDNTICICDPSAFRFFEKVFNEIKTMYTEANLPMKTFNIGADELPFGVWRKSPLCEEYIRQSDQIDSYQSLYDDSVKKLNKIVTASGARMAGWEDVLLSHSEKSQSEIEVNENLMDLDFIPSVWNNSWGEGREDMIYKLNNMGFEAIMCNSSAFYFDMTDDGDMENSGLSWSGFVSYKDSWGTEPLDVFANKVKLESLGIEENSITNRVQLKEEAQSNFLGIQAQLWTETATDDYQFDRMLMPNMIVFSERAWSNKEPWLQEKNATSQAPGLNRSWNRFVNSIGQRHLPMLATLYPKLLFDIPKPGAVVVDGMLFIRQQFPGMEIRYTRDGTIPKKEDAVYTNPITVTSSDQLVVRLFDTNGRGSNPLKIISK